MHYSIPKFLWPDADGVCSHVRIRNKRKVHAWFFILWWCPFAAFGFCSSVYSFRVLA